MIDENVVCFVHPIVVLVFVDRDPSDRIEFTGRIGVLHVAAQFNDEHPAVPVEGNLAWLFDIRISQHRLDLEAGWQPELLLLFGGREGNNRRLLREVRLVHRCATTGAAAPWRAGRAGRGWSRWLGALRGRLCGRRGPPWRRLSGGPALGLGEHRQREDKTRGKNADDELSRSWQRHMTPLNPI